MSTPSTSIPLDHILSRPRPPGFAACSAPLSAARLERYPAGATRCGIPPTRDGSDASNGSVGSIGSTGSNTSNTSRTGQSSVWSGSARGDAKLKLETETMFEDGGFPPSCGGDSSRGQEPGCLPPPLTLQLPSPQRWRDARRFSPASPPPPPPSPSPPAQSPSSRSRSRPRSPELSQSPPRHGRAPAQLPLLFSQAPPRSAAHHQNRVSAQPPLMPPPLSDTDIGRTTRQTSPVRLPELAMAPTTAAVAAPPGLVPDRFCLCQPDPKIPRPRNAFILFRQHLQAGVVAANPGLSNPEISKVIGERWRALPDDARADWRRLAGEEKKRHQQQYPDYRYQPRRYTKRPPRAVAQAAAAQVNGSTVVGLELNSAPLGADSVCPRCGGRSMAAPLMPGAAMVMMQRMQTPMSTETPTQGPQGQRPNTSYPHPQDGPAVSGVSGDRNQSPGPMFPLGQLVRLRSNSHSRSRSRSRSPSQDSHPNTHAKRRRVNAGASSLGGRHRSRSPDMDREEPSSTPTTPPTASRPAPDMQLVSMQMPPLSSAQSAQTAATHHTGPTTTSPGSALSQGSISILPRPTSFGLVRRAQARPRAHLRRHHLRPVSRSQHQQLLQQRQQHQQHQQHANAPVGAIRPSRAATAASIRRISYVNKIKLLSRISPPASLSLQRRHASQKKVRVTREDPDAITSADNPGAALVAVDGHDGACVRAVAERLCALLGQDPKVEARLFEGPACDDAIRNAAGGTARGHDRDDTDVNDDADDSDSEDAEDADDEAAACAATARYLDTISTWHRVSAKMLAFLDRDKAANRKRSAKALMKGAVKTEGHPASVDQLTPTSLADKSDSRGLCDGSSSSSSSSSSTAKQSSPDPDPTSGAALPDNEHNDDPFRIALIPSYQLSTADTAASATCLPDVYAAPADHWYWLASLWRGCVGADVTVYVREPGEGEGEGEEGDGSGSGKVEVRLEDARAVVIERMARNGGDGVGRATVEEKALRRVRFEVEEFLRG